MLSRTEWYIDKQVKGYGRPRESTGCSEVDEAERTLTTRLEEIRKAKQFGERPRKRFRIAAAAYLKANAHKRSTRRDADALEKMDSYIGDEWLHLVVNSSFDKYWEVHSHQSVETINRDLGAVKRVLKFSATVLTVPHTALTWLEKVPTILLKANPRKRSSYPVTWDEQKLLLSELATHLQPPALFKVNTGTRDEEVCALEWAWEQPLPGLDVHGMQRSVFVIPPGIVKNELPRAVVMNDVAQSVVDTQRGLHPSYVFTCRDPHGRVIASIGCSIQDGEQLVDAPRSDTRRSWGRNRRMGSGGSARTISNTPSADDCGQPASASRIARTCWVTRRPGSRPITARPRSGT